VHFYIAIFQRLCPCDHKMMPQKFRDDICNSSGVIIWYWQTDKKTHKQTLPKAIAPSLWLNDLLSTRMLMYSDSTCAFYMWPGTGIHVARFPVNHSENCHKSPAENRQTRIRVNCLRCSWEGRSDLPVGRSQLLRVSIMLNDKKTGRSVITLGVVALDTNVKYCNWM